MIEVGTTLILLQASLCAPRHLPSARIATPVDELGLCAASVGTAVKPTSRRCALLETVLEDELACECYGREIKVAGIRESELERSGEHRSSRCFDHA